MNFIYYYLKVIYSTSKNYYMQYYTYVLQRLTVFISIHFLNKIVYIIEKKKLTLN